jgi:hypothetical protein
MNIVVNDELKAYIDPLTPDEHAALERSLLAEGCRDALVLWGDLLVDGHNRYGICQKHGLPFQTVQSTRFNNLEDVHLWMIDQHLGRRSLSDFQRGVLALRKREIVAERRAQWASQPAPVAPGSGDAGQPHNAADLDDAPWHDAPQAPPPGSAEPLKSREDIAKAARLSSSQVVLIEKIQKQAAPALVGAIKAGTLSLNAAAAVASLPSDEQEAAVAAGKDGLKQAAKRVREARDAQRKPRAGTPPDDTAVQAPEDDVPSLQRQVQALQAENAALRAQVLALQTQLAQEAA